MLSRASRLAVVALLIAGAVPAAQPAYAAGRGYVRLAHLSPDTPAVDVYLSSQTGAISEQVFPGVGYGVMSAYLALPAGGYTVSMRASGAPKSAPPVLTTQVSVAAGEAYTIAGVGRYADLGLRVLTDDLSLPANGQAKVRVIQASVQAPVLGVALPDGTSVAENVAFATATAYQLVKPGDWRLVISPADGRAPTGVDCSLQPGNVYSLLILDGPKGLRSELRTDATRSGGVPTGGVETGAGGAAPPLWPMAGALLLVAMGALWGLRRRAAQVW
ncbi:DUF4397 domain-containing protein [Hamadaea sp.]|uniref:DUF4397 domain-containing protein n=1 Tax=Hamadaea sp. TaxID=2024425 RepID=UPI0025C24347|nr:DUF4397 domain-containing protein [Hamadaea sp.]